MPAVALLAYLRRSGATVSLTPENRVRVEAPPGLLDGALRAAIRADREDLLALLHAEESSSILNCELASFASVPSGPALATGASRTLRTQRTQLPQNNIETGESLDRDHAPDHSPEIDRAWTDGLQRLMRMPAPSGFTDERWRTGIAWCWRLAHEHGEALHLRGWTAAELFGLHPIAPATRYDAMGLAFLMRPNDRLLDLGDEHAIVLRSTGAIHRFTRASHSAESRPAWLLQPAAQKLQVAGATRLPR